MKTWFTSDLHFRHGNVIKYCRRPVAPPELIQQWIDNKEKIPLEYIERMNNLLLTNYQACVGKYDRVYILGDFCFAKAHEAAEKAAEFLEQMPGEKILIPGNHDPKEVISLPHWKDVSPLMDIRVDGYKVTLCHYMMKTWNKAHHGALQLFGHSHGSMIGTSQQCDVGVDAFDYKPVQIQDCLERMKSYPAWKTEDHHT